MTARLRLTPAVVDPGGSHGGGRCPRAAVPSGLRRRAGDRGSASPRARDGAGRRLELVVVDDGSQDATAAIARGMGVEVLSLGANRGLGAAVRQVCDSGSSRALRRSCSATPMVSTRRRRSTASSRPCSPTSPTTSSVAGSSDASTTCAPSASPATSCSRPGSRSSPAAASPMVRAGTGPSPPAAAAAAEVIHDYNYAQVLTLDLLAKGFRYAEVPISYRFRTTGPSFVTLGRYLRHVVPAVYRELSAAWSLTPGGASMLTVPAPRRSVTALLVVAACGNDDGAEVRDLGLGVDPARGPGPGRVPDRARALHPGRRRPRHPGRHPDGLGLRVWVGDRHRRGQRCPVDRQPD